MNTTFKPPRRALWPVALVTVLGLLCATALSLASLPVCAATSPEAFEAAFQQFQRANRGDESAIEGAARQFAALSAAEPADPVLLAYTCSATAMLASTTKLPWRRMSYAEDGIAQLDKALALLTPAHDQPLHHGTPGSLETRFVAANTFLALPGMFNRHPRGEKLLDEVLKSPLFAASPLPFRGAVWMRAGIEAAKDKRNDEARRWFDEVVKSGAPHAPAAQARLKEVS
jgi:hypothetical protein